MGKTRGDEGARRGPRLSDLLTLVVASAFGLAWVRAWAASSPKFEEYLWLYPLAEPHAWLLGPMFSLRRWAIPVLGPLTLGVLALMLRPPRPLRGELLAQPGTVACVVAAAVTLVQWGLAALFGYLTDAAAWWYVESRVFYGDGAAGMAVAMGWGLLLLAGRWRPTAGWRDRAGRLLGAAWILVWVASLTLHLYPRYAPLSPEWRAHFGLEDDHPEGPPRPESRPQLDRSHDDADESPAPGAAPAPPPDTPSPEPPEDAP